MVVVAAIDVTCQRTCTWGDYSLQGLAKWKGSLYHTVRRYLLNTYIPGIIFSRLVASQGKKCNEMSALHSIHLIWFPLYNNQCIFISLQVVRRVRSTLGCCVNNYVDAFESLSVVLQGPRCVWVATMNVY